MDALAFIWHLTLGLLITAALLGTGLLVAFNWQPERQPDDSPVFHLLMALGWGFGLVPFIAFAIVLFPNIALVPGITLGVAAIVALFAWLRLRRLPTRLPVQLREGWHELRPVLAVALAIGLFYVFKYDRSVCFLESCIHRVVIQVLKMHDQDVNLLYSNRDDQRLGNPAVISSFVVLYRGLGFRLLYGFLGFSAALGGWALGRRVFGHDTRAGRILAWSFLLFLPLNPYVAKIPLLDENLLTLGFSSLMFPFLLRARVPWAHVGLMFGLVVMMQHAAILCGLAICWAIWVYPERDKRLRAFLVAFPLFVLVTSVCHIHHYLALGSLLKFESFGQIPAFPHRLFGMYEGLLQWPFGPELVRTPWNPFPTFLMWPIYLADMLGLVLFASIGLGLVWLGRHQKKDAVFWLLWFVLPYIALSLQENWDVPNKMGIIYMVFHPILVWAFSGILAVVRQPLRYGVPLGVLTFAFGASAEALRHLRVPEDLRYYVARFGERREDPEYVAAERDLVTDIGPWPDYSRIGPVSQVFDPAKLRTLVDEIIDPIIDRKGTPYGWFPNETVKPGAARVVLEIDLRQKPLTTKGFVRLAPAGSAVDFDQTDFDQTDFDQTDFDRTAATTDEPVSMALPGIAVSWSPRPVTLLLSPAGSPIAGVYMLFEPWGDSPERREYLQDRYSRGLQMVLGWHPLELFRTKTVARAVGADPQVLRIAVPAGPFSIVESVNNSGQLYYAWQAEVTADQVALDGPRKVFHN